MDVIQIAKVNILVEFTHRSSFKSLDKYIVDEIAEYSILTKKDYAIELPDVEPIQTEYYDLYKTKHGRYMNFSESDASLDMYKGFFDATKGEILIDDVNIETASAYYNANIQSLEFICYGIKFNIKLNSKIVNSFIHLDEYTGFEVFVLNDYDMSKRNELYVSLAEKFILLINH